MKKKEKQYRSYLCRMVVALRKVQTESHPWTTNQLNDYMDDAKQFPVTCTMVYL